MHGNICSTYQVHDVDELKQRLTKVWHGLRQSVIDDAMDEWHKRLWTCVHVKGENFEHLIWFKSTHMLMFRSNIICYWVNYIKRIAIVDLLYFTRQCSYTFNVRWEIWHEPCCKFTAEYNGERIFTIGQQFLKLWTNIEWHVFMAAGVQPLCRSRHYLHGWDMPMYCAESCCVSAQYCTAMVCTS